MPVLSYTFHVQCLDLQHTSLSCQPVAQLVQKILPALPHFAMDYANTARLSASSGRSFLAADSAFCARRSRFLALRKCLGAEISSNVVPSKVVTSVATPRLNADRHSARRKRFRANALELRRQHPTIAVTPNTGRKQTSFWQVAAAKPNGSDLGHARRLFGHFGRLSDDRDARLIDEFLLDLGKAALPTSLAFIYHSAQRRIHPSCSVEHSVRGKIGQPFRSDLRFMPIAIGCNCFRQRNLPVASYSVFSLYPEAGSRGTATIRPIDLACAPVRLLDRAAPASRE